MNLMRLCVLGTGLLLLGSSFATGADDDEQKPKRGQFQQGQFPGFGRGGGALLSETAVEKLKLTAEQKERFGRFDEEFKEKQKANGAKLREAFESKDREKMKAAFESMRADSEKLRGEYLTKVEGFLTDDQKKTFAEVKNDRGGRPGFAGPGGPGSAQVLPPFLQERLKLTDEQKQKIEALQKEVESKVSSILTDEQRKQLEELRKQGPPQRRPNQ